MSKGKDTWIAKKQQTEMQAFEKFCEEQDLKEHAQDFINTYTNEEIAQMVREKVLTIEEVEAGLRRSMKSDLSRTEVLPRS